jgi:hypothetical protein
MHHASFIPHQAGRELTVAAPVARVAAARSLLAHVGLALLGELVHQQPQRLHLPAARRPVHGRAALEVGGERVGAALQQHAHRLQLPLGRRHVQRGVAVHVLQHDSIRSSVTS